MSLLNSQYAAISAINSIVESDEPMEKIHDSIQLVRRHLEHRAHQTATPFIPADAQGNIVVPPLEGGDLAAPGMSEALAADATKLKDLIGAASDEEPPIDPELAKLLGDIEHGYGP